ncbi:hypothetical protein PAPYR_12300 [Paratrimastix pyriformis]|uniref:Uncharacterized protein n=1 Tax=Paratrimastix pyriformis TaxID=342808 RepID=A0ABQ8U243_9EUKA|nr:hypothetical protein PAPYR_12300 [Paratrimastix pyriformis]
MSKPDFLNWSIDQSRPVAQKPNQSPFPPIADEHSLSTQFFTNFPTVIQPSQGWHAPSLFRRGGVFSDFYSFSDPFFSRSPDARLYGWPLALVA